MLVQVVRFHFILTINYSYDWTSCVQSHTTGGYYYAVGVDDYKVSDPLCYN